MDKNIIIRLLKTNQRLKAFNLGNIISDEHNIKGNNILPNPPINLNTPCVAGCCGPKLIILKI